MLSFKLSEVEVMPAIGSNPPHSQHIPQPSTPELTFEAPKCPTSQWRMSSDSHQLIRELHHALTNSLSSLDKVSVNLQELMIELHQLRKDSYEYIGKGTPSATGAIKEGINSDPEKYREKLMEFTAIKANLKEIAEKNPLIDTSTLPEPHIGSAIYGDLMALNEGRNAPDFEYNKNYLQYV